MHFRRSITMPIFMSLAVAGLGLLFVNADRPLDDLGCREDETKNKYTCHTGPLAGSVFGSREDAQIELDYIKQHTRLGKSEESRSSDEVAPPVPVLKVLSWNLKRTGKEKFDFDRIANVIADTDIAALQSLDAEDNGKGPLHIVADLVQQRSNQKICRAWFRTKGKERFAFLWKESTVSLVDQNGELRDPCMNDKSVVFPPSTRKDIGFNTALFYSKPHRRFFHLTTALLDSKVKEHDVAGAFRSLSPSAWPAIVAGNLQFSSKHSVFKEVRKLEFRPAMVGRTSARRSSPENFWTRKAVALESGVIDLYARFSEVNSKQLDSTVSENFPVFAAFSLTDDVEDAMQTQMLRAKRDTTSINGKNKKKARLEVAKPKAEFQEPKEDLEEEAKEADGGVMPVKKSKKPKKKGKP